MTRRSIVTMDRTVSPATFTVASCLAACALAAGVAGCGASGSSAPPGDSTGAGGGAVGNPGGSGPIGPGGTTVGPSGTGGQITAVGGSGPAFGGAPPIGGTGPITNGGTGPGPGAGGAGTAGAPPGAGGAAGGAAGGGGGSAGAAGSSNMGCGQGSFCQPADDLAPPAAADGFQIVSPSSISVAPGQEQFLCYYKTIPGGMAATVGGFRSWMTKGASHHFIVFQGSGGADGSVASCAFGNGAWIYATSRSGMLVGMDMPPQVGLPFSAGTSLVLNMHLVNTGLAANNPVIKLNVLFAKDVKYNAAAAYSALSPNLQINVPPLGTQTVHGTCTVPAGSKFFLWTTHTHKYATNVDINYVSGGMSTRIVNTTDWESPGTALWGPTDFLTTKAGDSFQYACTYKNPNSFAVTFGETAASNEMCMAIGYFFPAGPFTCN